MGAKAMTISPDASSDAEAWTDRLRSDGYYIIPDAMPAADVAALAADLAPDFEETALSVGPFYGDTTKRFHGLLRRSPFAAAFVGHPLILDVTRAILGSFCDRIQLNLTQAIEILPGGDRQPPHRDQDMWPIRLQGVEYLVNVMWPFTPYTADNGATIVWPGSHRRQDEIVMSEDDAIAAEMKPGSALVFLGSTLHAGGANRTMTSRRGMVISYSLGWLKPYELPWLAYPPEIARHFSPDVADLAGYRAHRPNLGTYEGRCPSQLLRPSTEPTRSGAIDVLRPEQEQLIGAYRAGQIPAGSTAEQILAWAAASAGGTGT
ncbi:phytanoyl-CoA dioxygenase family protein [Sphingomonas sp. 2R-10]|uniref:phytanoyl-CoA dioxygenase family protein n=1 Tax=Sphingomonas sp. 2R-10 TaxID=3045148 RepID=UPI0019D11F49|nr:phytanoyl-CoA dioxygenase family protein [Sphingomonas sp. 2R-10]MDJ0277707.1 phytanoyl-CoA dioxygenase family protein [Sphingomonas sp. 2R-10]